MCEYNDKKLTEQIMGILQDSVLEVGFIGQLEGMKVEFPADDYWRGYNEALDDAIQMIRGWCEGE